MQYWDVCLTYPTWVSKTIYEYRGEIVTGVNIFKDLFYKIVWQFRPPFQIKVSKYPPQAAQNLSKFLPTVLLHYSPMSAALSVSEINSLKLYWLVRLYGYQSFQHHVNELTAEVRAEEMILPWVTCSLRNLPVEEVTFIDCHHWHLRSILQPPAGTHCMIILSNHYW